MKIRSYIIKRFADHIKLGKVVEKARLDDEGYYRYSFHGKLVLVVNKLEHAQLMKQYPGQIREL